MSKKFVPSIDTKALYEKLKTVEVGATITYEVLTAVIGRDVQHGAARGNLNSALRQAKNDDQIVFENLQNVGYRRMNDEEIARSGGRVLKRVHRAVTRGARQVACANFDKLSNEAKVEHNTSMSLFGALGHFSAPKQVKQLSAKIEEAHEALPLAKLLEGTVAAFKK